jgi:hypothetical protein
VSLARSINALFSLEILIAADAATRIHRSTRYGSGGTCIGLGAFMLLQAHIYDTLFQRYLCTMQRLLCMLRRMQRLGVFYVHVHSGSRWAYAYTWHIRLSCTSLTHESGNFSDAFYGAALVVKSQRSMDCVSLNVRRQSGGEMEKGLLQVVVQCAACGTERWYPRVVTFAPMRCLESSMFSFDASMKVSSVGTEDWL